MANSFGGYQLFDANRVRNNRRAYRHADIPELQYANSLTIANGKWPARGWILMRRGDYNNLNPYTQYNLIIQDFGGNPQITFRNLSIVQARCVSRGVAADANAIYLVELTDNQGLISNPWFQFPTNSEYNIRAPAYPEQFYSLSMNGGNPWTWSQMIGSLWTQMGAFLGTYPGLPTAPTDTPEGWSLPGVNAWNALTSMLDYLGLIVTTDLTSATPYGIAVYGGTDTVNSALFTKYAGVLEDDYEYIDTGLGRVPLAVVVYFHRRNQFYGTEETVRSDSLQWASTPIYQVTVISSTYPNAIGAEYIWSDYAVEYDVNGIPIASSVATANSIATQLAANYYAKITRSTQGYLQRQYIGAIPFVTAGLVDGVCWRQDEKENRKGWVTEITRGMDPPFQRLVR